MNGLLIAVHAAVRVHAATAAMRSAMLGALVLALPFVLALPAQSVRLAQHSRLLLLAPPAWFLGIDRVLLGHATPISSNSPQLAAPFVAAAVVAAGSYSALYRRFDRVMLRSFGVARPRALDGRRLRAGRAAVRDFTAATLRRSALHQGVVVGLSACGVALATNTLLRGGMLPWLRGLDVPRGEILGAVTGMPFALIFFWGSRPGPPSRFRSSRKRTGCFG